MGNRRTFGVVLCLVGLLGLATGCLHDEVSNVCSADQSGSVFSAGCVVDLEDLIDGISDRLGD